MVYAASSLFLLGLLLIGVRTYVPTSISSNSTSFKSLSYAGMVGILMIAISCALTAYVGIFKSNDQLPAPSPVSGDFGFSANAASTSQGPAIQNGAALERSATNAQAAPAESAVNPMMQKTNATGTPSVFSLAQASQMCAGFSDVAMGALLAGAKNEPYAPYELKAKALSEQVMRLPFVREAGAKPMQYVSTLFATLIEDQYYISPQNRAVQLGLIGKVDRKLALDAMNQVCELKILEIRAK
ncbi:hypothetical protein [Undibacterium sp. TS12]|uniref:hypothetical protein n=1 Tax=Undibacterium sp. TS12 TaxID=2908202 RepID=UPI001F4C8F2D|nr:hypothetical protein [Undibacterium sp. TS12]MCH8621293.1 hypothetical protein [Undibacterium sp. TS12]